MKEGWGLGHRADPIDPKAVKYKTEQARARRLRPIDEALYLVKGLWAAVGWPFRVARRLLRGRDADEA